MLCMILVLLQKFLLKSFLGHRSVPVSFQLRITDDITANLAVSTRAFSSPTFVGKPKLLNPETALQQEQGKGLSIPMKNLAPCCGIKNLRNGLQKSLT